MQEIEVNQSKENKKMYTTTRFSTIGWRLQEKLVKMEEYHVAAKFFQFSLVNISL